MDTGRPLEPRPTIIEEAFAEGEAERDPCRSSISRGGRDRSTSLPPTRPREQGAVPPGVVLPDTQGGRPLLHADQLSRALVDRRRPPGGLEPRRRLGQAASETRPAGAQREDQETASSVQDSRNAKQSCARFTPRSLPARIPVTSHPYPRGVPDRLRTEGKWNPNNLCSLCWGTGAGAPP